MTTGAKPPKIAANLRFVRLERFVSDWLAQRGAGHVLEASELEGRLLAVLLDPAALDRDPELEALRVYLAAAGDAESQALLIGLGSAEDARDAFLVRESRRLVWLGIPATLSMLAAAAAMAFSG